MRVAVFTGYAELEAEAWWPVIARTPGVEAVLICRQLPPATGGAARRFWRNVKKHGPLWIPYRLGFGAVGVMARAFSTDRDRSPERITVGFPVEHLETTSLRSDDAVARVQAWKPDLGIALAAPILKPPLFTIPVRGTLNVHEGAVPEFRGAPPGFWELYGGAAEIGATAHWVDEGLDTGLIVAEARARIYPRDSLADVQDRAGELGRRVLELALKRIVSGDAAGVTQRPGGTTNRQPLLSRRLALAMRLASRRVSRRLTPRELAKFAACVASLWVYRPVRDLVRTLMARHPLRVYNLHRVTNLCRDGMTVSPGLLARQAAYLCRTHDVVSLPEALALMRDGPRLRRPAALLTFDDGYRNVYDHARPIFAELGITGCCFVSTDLVGTDRRLPHDDDNPIRPLLDVMTWEEVHALARAGWGIGSHSASHARLSACHGEVLRHEVADSRQALLDQLGPMDVTIAFPYGTQADISPEARDAIRAAGYVACFSDEHGELRPPCDMFDLDRIELGGDHDTLAWKARVHGISFERYRG